MFHKKIDIIESQTVNLTNVLVHGPNLKQKIRKQNLNTHHSRRFVSCFSDLFLMIYVNLYGIASITSKAYLGNKIPGVETKGLNKGPVSVCLFIDFFYYSLKSCFCLVIRTVFKLGRKVHLWWPCKTQLDWLTWRLNIYK